MALKAYSETGIKDFLTDVIPNYNQYGINFDNEKGVYNLKDSTVYKSYSGQLTHVIMLQPILISIIKVNDASELVIRSSTSVIARPTANILLYVWYKPNNSALLIYNENYGWIIKDINSSYNEEQILTKISVSLTRSYTFGITNFRWDGFRIRLDSHTEYPIFALTQLPKEKIASSYRDEMKSKNAVAIVRLTSGKPEEHIFRHKYIHT